MSRKVILFYPRHTKGWEVQPWCDAPLGLLCVATPLVHAGYTVKIIDQRIEPAWRRILQDELKGAPICVGMSSTTGPQLQYALQVSRLIKEYADVPVVWGGVHPSLLPQQTLQEDDVDVVVQGEGEATFLELVRALEEKKPLNSVKGIWYKDNAAICRTESRPFINLNEQPPLAWDTIEPRRYIRTVFGVERLSFFTSRGCPYGCAFCYNAAFNKRRWRCLEPELAVRRIKELVETYKVKGIFLTDSNSFVDMNWARQFLKALIRERLDMVITRMHICFDSLVNMNADDFALLEKAGCRCLAIGIESGSERIRNLLNKPIDVSALLKMNRQFGAYSFFPLYFFMIGFPTETKEEMKETVSLFSRLVEENPRASKSVNIYTPFPGTELFNLAVSCGMKPPQRTKDWVDLNYRSVSRFSGFLSDEMRSIVEMLDFCAFFVGRRSYRSPYKKTNKFIVFLSNLYAPIARKRIRNLYYRFPFEIKLAKLLRLYAKQS
ncbi:MAG TPA: radical SAM protein [Patescibacteria group bacterium]|nr:radical SAM protein [Patescibacteria group bacterium]